MKGTRTGICVLALNLQWTMDYETATASKTMSGKYSLWMQLGAAMTIKNTGVKEGNVVEIKRKKNI